MGSRSVVVCPLCLSTVWDKDFEEVGETIKEILDIIFINKSLQLAKGQVICLGCTKKVHDAFNFKYTCISTENILEPFIKAAGTSQIVLRDVYMKRNADVIAEDQRVCRLCLQLINSDFTSLVEKLQQEVIRKYIPEIVVENALNPVACENCIKSLKVHSAFISDCLYTIEIQNRRDDEFKLEINEEYEDINIKKENYRNGEQQYPINNLELAIKNEDVKMSDVNYRTGFQASQSTYFSNHQVEMYERKFNEINDNHYSYQMYASSTNTNILQANVPIVTRNDITALKQEIEQETDEEPRLLYDLDLHMLKSREPNRPETQTIKSGRDYKSKYRSTKKQRPKVKRHKCRHCDYCTEYANALKSHMFNHKDLSKIKLYECDKCDYKTKYRNALKSHGLRHKLPAEIQMRKCNLCSYETKHRTAFVMHQLKHKSPDEIEMYECDRCPFQTKYKYALKPHMSKHKKHL